MRRRHKITLLCDADAGMNAAGVRGMRRMLQLGVKTSTATPGVDQMWRFCCLLTSGNEINLI